jgi:hypothetical protein
MIATFGLTLNALDLLNESTLSEQSKNQSGVFLGIEEVG